MLCVREKANNKICRLYNSKAKIICTSGFNVNANSKMKSLFGKKREEYVKIKEEDKEEVGCGDN